MLKTYQLHSFFRGCEIDASLPHVGLHVPKESCLEHQLQASPTAAIFTIQSRCAKFELSVAEGRKKSATIPGVVQHHLPSSSLLLPPTSSVLVKVHLRRREIFLNFSSAAHVQFYIFARQQKNFVNLLGKNIFLRKSLQQYCYQICTKEVTSQRKKIIF